MAATVKVLVVDDSALIRQMLTRALSMDPRVQVVGIARNGVEAIEQASLLAPDVITMDIEMPELTGLEALPFIMKNTDSRVIMLSSLDDPDTTYQALSSGATDFISKPSGGFATSLTELSEVLLKKIRVAYRVEPAKRLLAGRSAIADRDPGVMKPASAAPAGGGGARAPRAPRDLDRVVTIASSTGGPPALERVFGGLSADLTAAYLIVQHLPQGFTESLARRLTNVTDIVVRVAEDGMRIAPGEAYIAPHGWHMTVAPGSSVHPRVSLEEGAPLHGVKPSADPLMRTAAREFESRGVGVVLTGMGSDGAQGIAEMRKRGADTIAQNEETSVVWGMPGAAYRTGAVQRVVPLDLVAAEIRRSIRGRG